MPKRIVTCALSVAAVWLSIACQQHSPAAPSTMTAPDATPLTVSLPPGRAAVLVPGDRVALMATLTMNGVSSDCTSAAIWSSFDERIAKFGIVAGELIAVTAGSVPVSARCGSHKAEVTVTVHAGLRITGFETEPFLLPGFGDRLSGHFVHLDVRRIDALGNASESCGYNDAVRWRTSDPAVVTVGAFPLSDYPSGTGWLIGHAPGVATVTASCGDADGQAAITVQKFRVEGTVRDASGAPAAGATVLLGQTAAVGATPGDVALTTDADGHYSGDWGFTSLDMQVRGPQTSSPVKYVSWNHQARMTLDAALPAPPRVLASGGFTLCRREVADPSCNGRPPGDWNVVYFGVDAAAPATVRATWAGFPNGRAPDGSVSAGLQVVVFCGDQTRAVSQIDASGNFAQTFAASPACRYSVVFGNYNGPPILPFTYAIEQ